MKRCPKWTKEFPDEANFCPVDAAELTATAGASVFGGRFEAGETLHEGALGTVYAAKDNQGGTACTVTSVSEHGLIGASGISRAERELKQLSRVGHKSVAKILGYGKSDKSVWFATESLEGKTLEETVSESGSMPSDEAARVLVDVIEGVAEAAKLGVIHRDLGPKNIVMTPGGPKVINFTAPVASQDGPNGVTEYLAPEQVDNKPVDQRSNIYSLGATFYFMTTGKPPYQGERSAVLEAHKTGNPTPPSAFGAVDETVDGLILKALQVSSGKRFMTLRQFLDGVRPLTSGTGVAPAANPKGKNAPAVGTPGGSNMAKTMMGMGAVDLARLSAVAKESARPEAQAAAAAPPVPSAPSGPSRQVASSPVKSASAPPIPQAPPVVKPAQGLNPSPDAVAAPRVPAATSTPPPAAVAPPTPALARAGSSGGKGKAKAAEAKARPKQRGFRETLWFKKGELDEHAAEEAAKAASQGRDDVIEKADSMPMEDRYNDDGSVTKRDQDRLSLKTGETLAPPMGQQTKLTSTVSESELLAEMRNNQKWVIGGIMLAVVVAIVAIVLL